jgi:basic amino acid/polyamine antiporter, APA family
MGPWATPLIVTAVTVAIGKSLNAVFLVFSRTLYAMGKSGVAPRALGRVHPRWGTPHVACLVVFSFCVAGLLLPMNLVFLFLALSIPTLLQYTSTSLCAASVVKAFPEVYQQARWRMSRRAHVVWAYAGAFSAVSIVGVGLQADWRPYVALLIWAAIGAVFYVVRRRKF